MTQPVLAPVSELRHVVVFLKDAPALATESKVVDIRQKDENFIPRVVAVPIGSEVGSRTTTRSTTTCSRCRERRRSTSDAFHAASPSRCGSTKPGVVKVFCEIHSHMSATIMVFDHPWFAMVGEDGRFELPHVPPGEREITAWHERLGDRTVPVRVESGRATEADFVLPVPAQ